MFGGLLFRPSVPTFVSIEMVPFIIFLFSTSQHFNVLYTECPHSHPTHTLGKPALPYPFPGSESFLQPSVPVKTYMSVCFGLIPQTLFYLKITWLWPRCVIDVVFIDVAKTVSCLANMHWSLLP